MVKLRNIRLSKFCFCCDLQKGVIGVGNWSGLLCVIILIFHIYLIIKYSMVDDEKLVLAKKNELKYRLTALKIFIGLDLVACFFSILLLIGTVKKKKFLLVPVIVYSILYVALLFSFDNYLNEHGRFRPENKARSSDTYKLVKRIFGWTAAVISTYMCFCVYSLYWQFKDEETKRRANTSQVTSILNQSQNPNNSMAIPVAV